MFYFIDNGARKIENLFKIYNKDNNSTNLLILFKYLLQVKFVYVPCLSMPDLLVDTKH